MAEEQFGFLPATHLRTSLDMAQSVPAMPDVVTGVIVFSRKRKSLAFHFNEQVEFYLQASEEESAKRSRLQLVNIPGLR